MDPVALRRVDRRWHLRLAAAVAAAVLLGMAVTLTVSSWLSARDAAHARERLHDAGDSLVDSLRLALAAVDDQAAALAGLLGAHPDTSPESFDAFADELGPVPGAAGAGYAVMVPAGRLDEFVAAEQERNPGFKVTGVDDQGRAVPPTDSHTHLIIVHFRSVGQDAQLEGLCLYTDQAVTSSISEVPDAPDFLLTPFLRLPGSEHTDQLLALRRVAGSRAGYAVAVVIPFDPNRMMAARGFGGQWRWQITDIASGQVAGALTVPPSAATYTDHIYLGRRLWQVTVFPGGSAALGRAVLPTWLVWLAGTALSLSVGGAVFLAVARRRSRREERRLRTRMAARERFLASVSHELRTPLACVIGFLDSMPDPDRLSPEQREHVAIALEQSREMGYLVEDLLTGTRIDSDLLVATPLVIDLAGETTQVLAALSREAQAQITEVSGRATAWADPGRVRQILRNLLDNAIKHGSPPIGVRLSRSGGTAHIEVSDRGGGVRPEQLTRLFAPYQSMHGAPNQPENIGLGLWLSRRLAHLMGGDISYRREDDHTVFDLSLPGAEAAPETVRPVAADAPAPARAAGSTPDRELTPARS